MTCLGNAFCYDIDMLRTMKGPIISLRGITKQYPPDIIALSDIDLSIEKGEFVFLTGPSGSGKSTLLKLLSCMERPTSGELSLDDFDLTNLSASQVPYVRRKVGVIFQDFKLITTKTVFENVALSLEVIGLSSEQISKRVRDILELMGLASKTDRYPPQLSGGEQQRVAIARAVVNRPSIILADEPTGNLDRGMTNEVMALVEELNAEGATVIFATHDESLFAHTYRRVLTIHEGRLRA